MSDYGSVTGVEALATPWTRLGHFYNEDIPLSVKPTNPPLSTVQDWLDSVSKFMNLALKEAYFVTPINQTISPDSFGAVSEYVNSLVTDLVAARNSRGRFFTDYEIKSRLTRFAQIQYDLSDWVTARTEGFRADGVLQAPLNAIRRDIPTLYIVEDE